MSSLISEIIKEVSALTDPGNVPAACRKETEDDCVLPKNGAAREWTVYRWHNPHLPPEMRSAILSGEKFEAELDNAINRRIYDEGKVKGEYVDCLDFVLEGGSIESDGKGTIFTTSCCLLAPHRNQPMTKDEIEARLKKGLCAERVLWIDYGNLVGDDTDGHIDTLVRIAPNDTLLYIGCNDEADEQYEELKKMEEQLKTFRTMEGEPYKLVKLPTPRPIYDEDSERLPATYANFLIMNGAVLVPTYNQPDLDAEAMKLIGEVFPDREIVGIDCRSVIKQHGSLHCCTMQYPRL